MPLSARAGSRGRAWVGSGPAADTPPEARGSCGRRVRPFNGSKPGGAPAGENGAVSTPDAAAAFEALLAAFPTRTESGLVEIRRSGDEAMLMFRWKPHPHLFGVPVPLTRTDRRLDWDEPAVDLDDWLESVELWLMEDVENSYLYTARRRRVDDYIELRQPEWPTDSRFVVDVVDPGDRDSWLRVPYVSGDGLDPSRALERRKAGTLVAWITAYENNSTGMPYVGQAIVVRESATVARLEHTDVIENAPPTLVLDIVRTATHAAADAGAQTVITQLDLDHLDVAGFRRMPDGQLSVDTTFLAEDPDAAEAVHREALAVRGRWGRDRDQAGRYLPTSRIGRLLHLLRHRSSGRQPRVYAG